MGVPMKYVHKLSLGVFGALPASVAFAAVDTTEALASIADAETAIGAVGVALIGVAAVAMALRWVKAMFF